LVLLKLASKRGFVVVVRGALVRDGLAAEAALVIWRGPISVYN
jgi:hypothetical protein